MAATDRPSVAYRIGYGDSGPIFSFTASVLPPRSGTEIAPHPPGRRRRLAARGGRRAFFENFGEVELSPVDIIASYISL
jgi:hypothetical protein